MKHVLKQFKVYAPPVSKANTLNKDGTLTITGVASTTNQDLDGEIISEKALNSLKNQAVGLNLHLDHNHDYNGGIGAVTEAHIEENTLVITANVLPEHAKGILDRLKLGMNMGFSIGGIPIIKNSRSNIIDDFILLEISLTLLPANWDTFGTVESKNLVESNCLTGACHHILSEKKKKENNLVSDTMDKAKQSGKVIDDATKQELVDIVNEAIINLKPLILDELKEEMVKLVQEVVATALGDVVPKAIDEIKANAVPQPPVEEEVPTEEKAEEEPVDEEVVEVEEKEAEEEEGVEQEVPVDEVIEEEKEVPDKVPVSGIPATPSDVGYAQTTQTITAPTFTIDSKAVAEQVLAEVWKQLDAHRDTTVQKESKLEEYKAEQKEIVTKSKFLDSDTRDKFGRNKKFL